MSAGDPQGCYIHPSYTPQYPHYYGPQYPSYYHYQPYQNFCPCCGQRMNHNQIGAGGGSWTVRSQGQAIGGQQNAGN